MTDYSIPVAPEIFMQRCLQLAGLGAGLVAPNPLVGAVLVNEGRIIGEGFHQQFGGPHAEVNCIASVREEDRHLIPSSTLYVSLEPCAHYGKTPPCADLIIRERIPKVVIGCRDPFEEVNGKGVEKLEAAGVEVVLGLMETASKDINRRFFVFHEQKRPYIVLKWAETSDHKIGFDAGYLPEQDKSGSSNRLLISNEYSNRVVHRWRNEEAGILVGSGTAMADNPELTNRLWTGPSPVRIVIDRQLRLPGSLKIFDQSNPTIVLNNLKQGEDGKVRYYRLDGQGSLINQILKAMFALNILSVLVEGGARLLQAFIDEGAWDEIKVIRNNDLFAGKGLVAPELKGVKLQQSFTLLNDTISIFRPAVR